MQARISSTTRRRILRAPPNLACINYPSQPQGQFIYAPTSAELGQAFLAISSQILRLSH